MHRLTERLTISYDLADKFPEYGPEIAQFFSRVNIEAHRIMTVGEYIAELKSIAIKINQFSEETFEESDFDLLARRVSKGFNIKSSVDDKMRLFFFRASFNNHYWM